jgi:hypothetical protein
MLGTAGVCRPRDWNESIYSMVPEKTVKEVVKSKAGFLAEVRTVKCKQRRVRSVVGHTGTRLVFQSCLTEEIIKLLDDED